MNAETGELTVERPLKRGEVRIFSAENFGDQKQTLKGGEKLEFNPASIQLGPQTGVTLFDGHDCTGSSQSLMSDLASFAASRLNGKPVVSLDIWPTAKKQFGGYWAIEVDPGKYLSVGTGCVMETSDTITDLATFRISEAGAAQGTVVFTPRGPLPTEPEEPSELSEPAAPTNYLTIHDFQKIALQAEPGRRKFSILSAENQYFAYIADAQRFTLTSIPEERAIFCKAIRIANDESQLGALAQGEVALFENPAYWGKAWVLDTDYADFGKVGDLNDAVSSIQLGPLTGVTIYHGANLNQQDPEAPKQDVTSNLPALEKEQVGEDQITSMDIWLIVPPEGEGVTFTCKLSQDFRGQGATFQEFSSFRTTLRLPATVQNVEVWTTDETDITVDGMPYRLTEDKSITVPPNKLHRLVITSDAIGATAGEPARGCLKSPGLKIRTDAMLADQRIVIYPDREVHERLAGLKKDEMWNATYTDDKGMEHPIIKDRSPKKQEDVANAQSMITRVMSTVKYSSSAGGGQAQTISGAGLMGKSWALDFSTCQVTVRTLFVREGPGLNYETKGYLKRNEVVQILGFNVAGDWIHIRRPSDGFEGWSYGMYLGKIIKRATEEEQYRVTAKALHVREGPGRGFRSVGLVYEGAVVAACGVDETGTWRRVVREDGLTGWSSARYLKLVPPEEMSFGLADTPTAAPLNPQPPTIPGLTPNVRFHEISEADVQALLARAEPADEEMSFGWFKNVFKEIFNAVKTAVSVVVTAVEDTWAVIVDLGEKVVKWVIDTAEKAIACVEGIIEKIGAVIEEVIKWLRFLFNWKDILSTRDYLRRSINTMLDYIGKTLVKEAETPVTKFFDEQKRDISDKFEQAIKKLGGTPDKARSNPPSGAGDGLEAVDWILSKITETGAQIVGAGSFLSIPYPADADEKLLPFWQGALDNVLKIVTAGPEGIANVIGSLLRNPDQPQLAIAELLKMFDKQVSALLDLGEDMVLGLLKLAGYVIEKLKEILNANIRIPFISDLIEWIGKMFGKEVDASLGFSFLDAATLILAIPVTIISKAILGKAPFKGVPDLVLPAPGEASRASATAYMLSFDAPAQGPIVDGWTITAGVSGYLAGLVSIPLDMYPEGDDGLGGLATPLEVLSLLFNITTVACDRIPNIVSAVGTGKDREGTEADWIWWTLFGYEATVIVLDGVSFVCGLKKEKPAPERIRRDEQRTIIFSSILGGIYIVLLVAKKIQDEEPFLEALPDCLMALPEICPVLRLSKSPYTSLAYGIIDGTAGMTALVKGMTG